MTRPGISFVSLSTGNGFSALYLLVALLIDLIRFFGGESTVEIAKMNQVKGFTPGPLL